MTFKMTVKKEGKEEKSSLWLIIFTDIMALMLTFFVLLYSMSSTDEEKWNEIARALNDGFSKFERAKWNAGSYDSIIIEKLDMSKALDLPYLQALMAELVAKDDLLQDAVLIMQKDRMILSLPHDLLFKSGKAEVGFEGKKVLFAIGGLLSRIRNRIEIIGHADPRPISDQNQDFDSNWELSLARASNVGAVLEDVGYERSVVVRGLSSARYDELPDDIEEEERLSLSRRVDIVVMKDDGSSRSFMQLGYSR